MTTVRVYGGKAATKRAEGSPLLAGLLAAIGIIVVWVGLVYVTHHPVGVAAWGVGGLLGLVVAKVATPPTKASGALAAVLTFFTVLLAKVVVVVVALQPIIRQELANSPASLTILSPLALFPFARFPGESHPVLTFLEGRRRRGVALALLGVPVRVGPCLFPGPADPLLALAHGALLSLFALGVALHLVLGVRPPHHQEQPKLRWQHENEGGGEDLVDRDRDRGAGKCTLPPRKMLIVRGEIEERRKREEATTKPKHALICKTKFWRAIFFFVGTVPETTACPVSSGLS